MDNLILMHIWHLIIYLVAGGGFLVVLALALHERIEADSPAMAQTATAFGLIWAGLVIASGMLMIRNAGVVALGEVLYVARRPRRVTQVTISASKRGRIVK